MNSYSGYVASSAVPKYSYVPETQQEPKVHEQKKVSSKENSRLFYKVFLIGLFAAVFVIVLRSTIISQMNNQVAGMNNSLAKLEKEVQQSSVKLEAMTDLNTVQTVAMNELNMNLPQQHQIVEVELDMGSKAITVESGKGSGTNLFAKMWEFCKEYLY